MELHSSVDIQRSAETVWRILGTDFGKVGRFASSIDASSIEGPVRVGAWRTCQVRGFGTTSVEERVLQFDPDAMSLAYELARGAPWMVRRAINRWSVHRVHDERCRVVSHASVDIRRWMLPAYPMLFLGFTVMGWRFLNELKHYAERGTPHPRKRAIAATLDARRLP